MYVRERYNKCKEIQNDDECCDRFAIRPPTEQRSSGEHGPPCQRKNDHKTPKERVEDLAATLGKQRHVDEHPSGMKLFVRSFELELEKGVTGTEHCCDAERNAGGRACGCGPVQQNRALLRGKCVARCDDPERDKENRDEEVFCGCRDAALRRPRVVAETRISIVVDENRFFVRDNIRRVCAFVRAGGVMKRIGCRGVPADKWALGGDGRCGLERHLPYERVRVAR